MMFGLDIIKIYEEKVISDLGDNCGSTAPRKHNHPPIKGVMEDCAYCRTFGNVFRDGIIPLNVPVLKPYVKSLLNG